MMATLRSDRYPGLILGDLGVRFVNGALETDDKSVIKRARGMSALGVSVDDSSATEPDEDESDEDATEAPSGNASRQAWADHADSLGVEYPDGAKRDEIKDAVEAATDEDESDA